MEHQTILVQDNGEDLATLLPDTHMPSWKAVKIEDLLDEGEIYIKNGFAQGTHNQEGQGVPHLRPFNITNDGLIDLSQIKSVEPVAKQSDYWVHQGDVLFNNTNSEDLVGKTAYFSLEGKFLLSNHMTIIRILDETVVDAFWLAKEFQISLGKRLIQSSL